MKFFGQDILKKNPVLAISAIANFLPPRAAAHPASPSGCSPEGCGGGKRGGVPPALLPRLDLCSPGKPRPRLTAPPPPPAPPRPAAAVPPNHAPPASRAQAALPCPPRPSPPRPAPLRRNSGVAPMSRINKTAARIRLRGTAGPRTAAQCPPGATQPRSAPSVSSRSARPVPAGQDNWQARPPAVLPPPIPVVPTKSRCQAAPYAPPTLPSPLPRA